MSDRYDIDGAFAEELAALDAFFDRRSEEHEHFKLGRQDPDVRRILEAVALFAARTRRLAAANVSAAVERLVRGQLDDILTPMPAAGTIVAHAGKGLVARATVPEGTEVHLTTPDRTVGVFTTRRRLDILPLHVRSVEAPPAAPWLVIRLDAWVGLRGPLPDLSFFVDSRRSYRDSLRFVTALRRHVVAVRVAFDEDAPGAATVVPFAVGAPPDPPDGDGRSPLAQVRSFFHFPAQELFFSLTLPARTQPWTRAFVYLELDRDAPRELRAARPSFCLFGVPIENVRRADAAPILCDGTKDSYPIRDARVETASAGREARARLCSIEGVYRVGAAPRTREPLVPAVLASARAAYDPILVRPDEDPDGQAPRIALRIPGAFAKPCTVLVDARWYQPSFEASAAGLVAPSLPTRHVEGTRLELVGDLVLSRQSPLVADAPALLHVMALRTKATLSRDELVCILRCLGADGRSHYRRLPDLIEAVRVVEAPGNAGQRRKYVYSLDYDREDPEFEGLRRDGLVAAFEDKVAILLGAWMADDVELTRLDEPRRERPVLRAVSGGAS